MPEILKPSRNYGRLAASTVHFSTDGRVFGVHGFVVGHVTPRNL
jgi:dihydroxyacid dehydratase/phosphogluconate dehydratase